VACLMQEGADNRLHRLASSTHDSSQSGTGGEIMPHTALQRCLNEWVPMLVDECDFAAAFLLLYRPIEEAAPDPGDLLRFVRAASAVCMIQS
jgi:hypothetical protein